MGKNHERADEVLCPVPLLSDMTTREFVTDDVAVKDFEKYLVRNLINADISKSIALI